jgi:hypothetical protein
MSLDNRKNAAWGDLTRDNIKQMFKDIYICLSGVVSQTAKVVSCQSAISTEILSSDKFLWGKLVVKELKLSI